MVSIVILAGGKSSRFGQNKALLDFQGQPLVLHVIRNVQHLGDEVILVSNPPETLLHLGFPVVGDVLEGVGALGGLLTALEFARGEVVAVFACDMPFASAPLLQFEINEMRDLSVDVVIPSTGDGYEPLHAVFRRKTCLEPIKRAIHYGEKRLISWFGEVNVKVIPFERVKQFDPDGMAFLNINTPEDLIKVLNR